MDLCLICTVSIGSFYVLTYCPVGWSADLCLLQLQVFPRSGARLWRRKPSSQHDFLNALRWFDAACSPPSLPWSMCPERRASKPHTIFTDLTSGPVGAIVTIYGANLQSTVTVNTVKATVIASSATKLSFIVPATTSGYIVAGNSNALPFTVRAGNSCFVSANGSDNQSGSQSAPWATIPHAFNTAACGDIIYAMDGVSETGLDDYGASLSVERKCSEANPLALVGYPGATVTIGNANGQEYGIRTSGHRQQWVQRDGLCESCGPRQQ